MGEYRTVRTTDLPQIAPPTEEWTPQKITQRKDARIRVLLKDRFCHELQGEGTGRYRF